MRCPTDGAELVMAERQGVEIDYCPSCRGIWLDRGELDKILDRATRGPSVAGAPPAPAPAPADDDRGRDTGYREQGYRESTGYRDDRYDDRQRYGKKKRRASWLGDLLDFD